MHLRKLSEVLEVEQKVEGVQKSKLLTEKRINQNLPSFLRVTNDALIIAFERIKRNKLLYCYWF